MTVSVIFGNAFSFLISVIDQLQLIIHIPILNINIPANSMEFFSVAVPIVTYDVFENFEAYNDFIQLLTRSSNKEKKKRRLLKETKETKDDVLERITD